MRPRWPETSGPTKARARPASSLALGALTLLAAAWSGTAAAEVERFAVLIGNDIGDPHETRLRYAQSDAARVHEVLRDLGGFEPFNMVLLRDESSATVRRALLSINERVREAMSRPDTDVLLLVYYSGHADAEQLHLSGTRLAVRELSQLVRGSAASFRLVIMDACRSGSLTRLKGGRRVEPFDLPDARLPSDGLAFLTASSADEDAQESDELKSSFFTHSLVSGLLGAADRDGDGAVALDEAYRYAYDATLRSTSRTLAGIQHPTFRYEFRGSGDLVLTRPAAHAAERARLSFPPGMAALLMRDGPDGVVTAELSPLAPERGLSLRPGRYFLRVRGRDVLYEGAVEAHGGQSRMVDVGELRRIEYARLVRKGQRKSSMAHGPELGMRMRTPLPNESHICPGAFVGYAFDFEEWSGRARGGGCGSGFANDSLSATSTAVDLDLRLYRTWDTRLVSFELGLGGGVALLMQRFDGAGRAPSRTTAAPFTALGAGASIALGGGFDLGLEVVASTYFVKIEADPTRAPELEVAFALTPALWAARRF